jgi:hypothetical protein
MQTDTLSKDVWECRDCARRGHAACLKTEKHRYLSCKARAFSSCCLVAGHMVANHIRAAAFASSVCVPFALPCSLSEQDLEQLDSDVHDFYCMHCFNDPYVGWRGRGLRLDM